MPMIPSSRNWRMRQTLPNEHWLTDARTKRCNGKYPTPNVAHDALGMIHCTLQE